ncbi:hypothetical protein [Arthrobacter polaris]|uniref:hypothetical protein n=1 Tax=Arthrobacter polaris TaxID=2813727 RepID=UPI001F367F3D|nr:hypothetical protein [Arthrobacter polaris]UIK89899.1 hypothetical protein J0916_06090 [Arthrobacter polaris]
MTGQEPGKSRFSRIAVVFDPDPQKVALYLRRRLSPELAARMPDVSLDLLPTNHAGHGQELARTVVQRSITTRASVEAMGGPPVLIVCVSGEDGFNDVINGVMDVLKLMVREDVGTPVERYVHSSVGCGKNTSWVVLVRDRAPGWSARLFRQPDSCPCPPHGEVRDGQ